jgi:hypothetical protein
MPVANQPIVTDAITGLEWQGCQQGLSGAACDTGAISHFAWSDAIAACDGLSWAGDSDWRLPDKYEAQTLIDCQNALPAIDTTIFPGGEPTAAQWTITFDIQGVIGPVATNLNEGGSSTQSVSLELPVRCVRGRGAAAAGRFQRSAGAEPTVMDNLNHLVWQGCQAGQSGDSCDNGTQSLRSWSSALSYCEALTWATWSDWRLPNAEELDSLMRSNPTGNQLDAALFPNFAVNWGCWSSTTWVAQPSAAWMISFGADGILNRGDKTDISSGVLCVRDGS